MPPEPTPQMRRAWTRREAKDGPFPKMLAVKIDDRLDRDLRAAATAEGVPFPEYVRRLLLGVADHLPPPRHPGSNVAEVSE